jgi:hypothetical protein
MPDDQNITQNPISEENSIPPSPQEPMADIPIPATDSVPAETPPEAPESPRNADIPVSLNNDNAQNEPISIPSTGEAKPEEVPAEGGKTEGISEPVQIPETRTAQIPESEPLPVFISSKPSQKDLWKRFLDKVQIGKRKKLEKIMTLFLKNSKITNDEVEKFLHVSDATATRYLSILEKENKIKQVGKTGHAVSYSRI